MQEADLDAKKRLAHYLIFLGGLSAFASVFPQSPQQLLWAITSAFIVIGVLNEISLRHQEHRLRHQPKLDLGARLQLKGPRPGTIYLTGPKLDKEQVIAEIASQVETLVTENKIIDLTDIMVGLSHLVNRLSNGEPAHIIIYHDQQCIIQLDGVPTDPMCMEDLASAMVTLDLYQKQTG